MRLYRIPKIERGKRRFELLFCIGSLLFWASVAVWFGGGIQFVGTSSIGNLLVVLGTVGISLLMILLSFAQIVLIGSEAFQVEIDGKRMRVYFYHRGEGEFQLSRRVIVMKNIRLFRCDNNVGFGSCFAIYLPPFALIAISMDTPQIDKLIAQITQT